MTIVQRLAGVGSHVVAGLAGGALVLLVAGKPAQAGPDEVLRGRRIELVDEAGVVRGAMEIRVDKGVELWLTGPAGQRQVALAVSPQAAPLITLSDEFGRARMAAGFDEDGRYTYRVGSQFGMERVFLGTTADGTPMLGLRRADGTVATTLAYANGGSALAFVARGGEGLGSLFAHEEGGAQLTLGGPKAAGILSLLTGAAGSGDGTALHITGGRGDKTVFLGHVEGGAPPALVLTQGDAGETAGLTPDRLGFMSKYGKVEATMGIDSRGRGFSSP